jgi:putative hydrolase of the HAD superfamily
MIKAIFFDAAGVLYTRAGPTEAYALDLLRSNGYATEIPPDQAKALLALRSQANEGTVSHDIYWDRFLSLRGVLESEKRKDYTTRIINYSNEVLPMPGGRQALSGLKQQGFLLGIITDTMYPVEWKMRRLEKAGVAEFIDIVACSTDLGAHKPDPAVYTYAIQQAGLSPAETAFVGHAGIELQGARTAGMSTIAIHYDADARADFYCESLPDLLSLPLLQRDAH